MTFQKIRWIVLLVPGMIWLDSGPLPVLPIVRADETAASEMTIRLHDKGRLLAKKTLDRADPEHKGLSTALQKCLSFKVSESRDWNSYAPSVVVERPLHRVDLHSGRVVISRRSAKDKPWKQTSRKATRDDLQFREIVVQLLTEVSPM